MTPEEQKELERLFQEQLKRVESQLKARKSHVRGPRRPSMGQQEHGE
jgi:hypothetical protein